MSFFRRMIVGYSILYVLFAFVVERGDSLNPAISRLHAIWNLTLILWVVPVGLLVLVRWMVFGAKRRGPPIIDQN